MLPNHTLSTVPVIGYYLPPDDRDPSPILDYELGGVALFDASQGMMVRTWYARLVVDGVKETSNVYIGAEGVPEIVFFSGGDFTEVALAFDQNMNPFLAFIEGGQAKFYWFDAAIPGYTITTLPVGSRSPKCCLDDKRSTQVGESDILLFYMRGTTLYYREQRDRYLVEYTLATGLGGQDVLMCGMSRVNRVQIAIGLQDFPAPTINYRVTTEPRRRVTVNGDRRRLVKVSYG